MPAYNIETLFIVLGYYSEIRCIALGVLQTQKEFWCSVNHFSESGVNANHNVTRTRPAWQAENDSRLLIENSEGNRNGERIFLLKEGGRRCFILASDKKEKDHENLRSKLN